MNNAAGWLLAIVLVAAGAHRVDAVIRNASARYRHEGRHRGPGRRRWREQVISAAASGSIAVVAGHADTP